jgi:16S rRNA processing protein RimM
MAYNNDILLGRITKVSGYEGAVTVKVERIFTENIPQMESVFLEIEGRPVPFFISDSEYSGADILKLWFEGYDSVEKISEFTGCRVFLTKDTTSDDQKKPDDQLLTGYQVFTQEDALLGPVTDIISNNGQWLLNVITSKKKNLLIPFHEDLIISIDKENKTVVLDIPEGLLDIN